MGFLGYTAFSVSNCFVFYFCTCALGFLVINNEINVCSYQDSTDFEFLVTLLPSIKNKNITISFKSNQIESTQNL